MNDAEVVDRWWRHFVATGAAPDELVLVQGRLIRAVHRGALPSGPVHVKTMTFPRAKDRLRYALRALPAAHEAAVLAAAARAGLPCPEVVAVRTSRRRLLPAHSMLVLRSLDVVADAGDPLRRCRDEVDVAARLLAAGVVHRDLHTENFVRLRTGELAVLDMQSASVTTPASAQRAKARLAVAARLLRDRADDEQPAGLQAMRAAGLLRDEAEVRSVQTRIFAARRRFERSRIRRCLTTSTGFVRTVHWDGVRCRLRAGLGEGRWVRGRRRELEQAWLGQRVRQLGGVEPLFRGFFREWWWLGGGAALYVPATCSDDRIEAAVAEASAAEREGPGQPA